MTRIIQINVGVCRAAQDLALVTANVKMADVLIISEQYRMKEIAATRTRADGLRSQS